ncbi:MAG: HAD family hydrolase [Balneola sp.]|nr:MAG: HAD family hydrolase [Balneola sp.]
MSEQHPWIILFDIDGTLLTVDRNFNRPLLRSIIDNLEINYPDMEKDPFSGRTDFDIITSFLVNHGFDQNLYNRFKEIYLLRLEQEIKAEHILRHEYIDEAIDYFSGNGFVRGLLTGNFPSAAQVKLKVAGINQSFRFGAFGEYHKDRNILPELALEWVKENLSIHNPDPSRFIIIGDTPRDVLCAKHSGMRCVSVTTGKFSEGQLKEYGPDMILDNLSEPDKWFKKLVNGSS